MSPDELKQHVADGVAEGFKRVLSDPETIGAVMNIVVDTAQKKAAERAGMAFFGLAKSLLTKWIVIAAIVLLVAKVAGVDVATKTWKLITGGAP